MHLCVLCDQVEGIEAINKEAEIQKNLSSIVKIPDEVDLITFYSGMRGVNVLPYTKEDVLVYIINCAKQNNREILSHDVEIWMADGITALFVKDYFYITVILKPIA